ncbi:MAG: phosphodiester glycosidase family protein [Lachnospiraceae bacterium]|nr:phosphodiester glycosidase family protein [Lachnospiraceae bacterium]
MTKRNIWKGIGWFFIFLLTTVAAILLGLYLLMWMLCKGPSVSARNTFVATMLETGNLKFVVSWYLSEEEILAITQAEAETDHAAALYAELMADAGQNLSANFVSTEADSSSVVSNVTVPAAIDEIEEIGLIPITGRTFEAKLLVVRDPSRIVLASSYPWTPAELGKSGNTIEEYCNTSNAVAAFNAGEFETPGGPNWPGRPVGVVVSGGEILFNEPGTGDVMIGFNDNHILVTKEVGSMTPEQFEAYVDEYRIIDAVSFKDINDGDNNHFTKLIENGNAIDLNNRGVGANPRTAVGQCADGTVLILVTDGRGMAGHLGATGQDLINIFLEYGAVNAANLDGGSSSALYYEGEYQITSSYLPNADESRKLPTAFVVTQ